MPDSLIGPSGYLTTRQKNIESLRLITDGVCSRRAPRAYDSPALSEFPRLKRLSLVGLSSHEELNALIDTLQRLSHQLVEFELDLERCRYPKLSSEWDSIHSLFLSRVMNLRQLRASTFASLQSLSLSSLSFNTNSFGPTPMPGHIARTFNLPNLHSLKMRDCDGWELLLEFLTFPSSTPPIVLRSLEIWDRPTPEEFSKTGILKSFLESFRGLEDLFILTPPAPVYAIWSALAHHKNTLRRFVHHQRTMLTYDSHPYFAASYDISIFLEQFRDTEHFSLHDPSIGQFGGSPIYNCLGDLDLKCIGLSGLPKCTVCIAPPKDVC